MFKFFLGQNSIFKDRTVVRSTPAIRTQSTAPYSTAAAQCEAGRWPCEQQTDWKPVHLFWHICLRGFNWRRYYFYNVSPEQNSEWDISQRRQKAKREGNNQPLLSNAQPKCNLQLSVTPRHRRGSSRAVALCLHGCRLPDGTDFLLASFHSPS